MPCGALLVIAIINNGNDTKHLILDFLVSFLRFGCGDAFCSDTFLQTDEVTHRSLYKQTRYSYTERFAHKKKMYTHAFADRGFYAKKEVFTHRCFVQRCFCAQKAHRHFYTQNLLHRETFAQNSFYTCFFYTANIWQRETFAHRLHTEVFTQQNVFRTSPFAQKKIAPQFLQIDGFYTQNVLPTEV